MDQKGQKRRPGERLVSAVNGKAIFVKIDATKCEAAEPCK